jgi:hypothetical protein
MRDQRGTTPRKPGTDRQPSQSSSSAVPSGVHVGDQVVQLGRVKSAHGLGHAQQSRVTHLEDFSNGHGESLT